MAIYLCVALEKNFQEANEAQKQKYWLEALLGRNIEVRHLQFPIPNMMFDSQRHPLC